MDTNIDSAHSYATEESLNRALKRLRLDGHRHIVVRNRAGRFTAIFGLRLSAFGGDVTRAARHGFKTID